MKARRIGDSALRYLRVYLRKGPILEMGSNSPVSTHGLGAFSFLPFLARKLWLEYIGDH